METGVTLGELWPPITSETFYSMTINNILLQEKPYKN